MYVLFYVCEVIGFVDWFDRFIEVLKCAIAYNLSLTVLRWPCVVDRMSESSNELTPSFLYCMYAPKSLSLGYRELSIQRKITLLDYNQHWTADVRKKCDVNSLYRELGYTAQATHNHRPPSVSQLAGNPLQPWGVLSGAVSTVNSGAKQKKTAHVKVTSHTGQYFILQLQSCYISVTTAFSF